MMRLGDLVRPLAGVRAACASRPWRAWFQIAPVTFGFVALIVAIHGITWLTVGEEGIDKIATVLGTDVSALDGQWWTLLTGGLLHTSWRHLAINCAYILGAGVVLETAIRGRAMAGLILITTTAGSVGSLFFGLGLSVGASAVVYGILGALLAHPLQRDHHPVLSLRTWAPFLALLSLRDVFLAHDETVVSAHVAGLLVGAVYAAARRPQWEPGSRWRLGSPRFAVVGIASMAIVGVLAMDMGWVSKWHAGAAYRADYDGDKGAAARHARFILDHADEVMMRHGLAMAGKYLLAEGDSALAYEALNRGIRRYGPNPSDHHALLGMLRSRLIPAGEFHAELDLLWALDIDPTSPFALNALARFWISANDTAYRAPKHAIGIALSAVREDGAETPEYMDTLAQAYFMTGNHRQAVHWMGRVLKLDLEEDERAEYDQTLREMERSLVREGGEFTLAEDRW